MAAKRKGKEALVTRLELAEKVLPGFVDDFLRTNTRVDRDKLIKKREEIRTIKYILDEYI